MKNKSDIIKRGKYFNSEGKIYIKIENDSGILQLRKIQNGFNWQVIGKSL